MQPFTQVDDDTIRAELATIIDAYLDANPSVVDEYTESAPEPETPDEDLAETLDETLDEDISLPIEEWLAEDDEELDDAIDATTVKVFDDMDFTAEELGVANFSERLQNAASDSGGEPEVDPKLVESVGAKLAAGQPIAEDEIKKLADAGVKFRPKYAEG
jgi:hypothetical protein